MSTKRVQRLLTSVSDARSTLPGPLHPVVDSALKTLKTCSRRCQALLPTLSSELQILERIYYKGKNQHRPALFWKRVSEIRRLGSRFQDLELSAFLDAFRSAFYAETGSASSKTLKGAWTHFPNARQLLSALKLLTNSYYFLIKSEEHLVVAYNCFSLTIQPGYFVQLIVVLMAIVSRLHAIMVEVRSSLEELHATCTTLVTTLHPNEASRLTPLLIPVPRTKLALVTPDVIGAYSGASSVPFHLDDSSEDIGAVIARSISDTSVSNAACQANNNEGIIHVEEATLCDASTLIKTPRHAALPPLPVSHVDISITEKKRQPEGQPKVEMGSKKKKGKKKPKMDDIDVIFGF